MAEIDFKAEADPATLTMGENKAASSRARSIKYTVKKNLFQNLTFAVMEDSYKARGEMFFESIRRKIIENGGVVVNENQKAHYVMFEDGYDAEVWNKISEVKDELSRNIISHRFIDKCIERGEILSHENALHICPLPQPVPV